MEAGSSRHAAAQHPVDVDSNGSEGIGSVSSADRPAFPANNSQIGASVGFIFSTEMAQHYNAVTDHPECPERILSVYQALLKANCLSRMKHLRIREAQKDEVLLVHSLDHWYKVLAFQQLTDQEVVEVAYYYDQNLSLYVMEGTTRAALLSCGGVIEACLSVALPDAQVRRSIAIVRPPGHHAEPEEHMGFCILNNAAVAARVVQMMTPMKKILILDWDIHHGNGTHKAFNDDPTVLYISIHRYEDGNYYPSGPFGGMYSCGVGAGLGFSVNIPWPHSGMKDEDYLYAFQKIVMPIAIEFSPDMVIISAGFDAAAGDELGQCFVTPAGYAHMTHMLCGLAHGRVSVALEGGYNLEALANSTVAVTRILLGDAPPDLPPLAASDDATEVIWQVARVQSRYWRNIDVKACEPPQGIPLLTPSIQEILKAHRQHNLYAIHRLMVLPLLRDELSQRFSSQVLCSTDMLTNDTLIIFVHELGNLRAELESSLHCNLQLERANLLDLSRELITWVRKEQYAILDVNLFAKPSGPIRRNAKAATNHSKEMMHYIWDNYVMLSKARKIVLIGNGTGCSTMMDCLDNRWSTAFGRVRGVVQVVGISELPCAPRSNVDFQYWYGNARHSLLAIPNDHPFVFASAKERHIRKHGTLLALGEVNQHTKLLRAALPAIQAFTEHRLMNNGVMKPRPVGQGKGKAEA